MHPRVAIIGAGISGLSCAQALHEAGASPIVFEKSRSLSGRLATRRWQGHIVDHGAPWFSWTHSPPPPGLAQVDAPFLQAQGSPQPEPPGGRSYLPSGNNRLAPLLAPDIAPRLESPIHALAPLPGDRWLVGGEVCQAVVITAPWPQARLLLAPWLPEPADPAEPRCLRTLTAFFEYPGPPVGPAAQWSGQDHANPILARSICENHKLSRILPGSTVLVAHATPAFSETHFASDPDHWSAALEAEVRRAWDLPAAPRATFTHRWGFSTVVSPWPLPPALPPGLFLAGDALSGSSIEAAAASGRAAARALLA